MNITTHLQFLLLKRKYKEIDDNDRLVRKIIWMGLDLNIFKIGETF